jgi:hypothetical protein
MLAVAIHNGEVWRRACQHSLYACRRETPLADSLKAADARILARDFADTRRCSVSRIVIYEDDLPGLSSKTILEAAYNFRHVLPFVKGRHDYGDLRNAGVGAAWFWQELGYLVLHLIALLKQTVVRIRG